MEKINVKIERFGMVNTYKVEAKKLPKISSKKVYTWEEFKETVKYYPAVSCQVLGKVVFIETEPEGSDYRLAVGSYFANLRPVGLDFMYRVTYDRNSKIVREITNCFDGFCTNRIKDAGIELNKQIPEEFAK